MNYKTLAKLFGYLMIGIETIMDNFSPDDDEELAEVITVLLTATNRGITICKDKEA